MNYNHLNEFSGVWGHFSQKSYVCEKSENPSRVAGLCLSNVESCMANLSETVLSSKVVCYQQNPPDFFLPYINPMNSLPVVWLSGAGDAAAGGGRGARGGARRLPRPAARHLHARPRPAAHVRPNRRPHHHRQAHPQVRCSVT